MKWLIIFLIGIHGLIHLMGFLKEWNLGSIPQLSGETLWPISEKGKTVFGIVWLVACILMIAVALLLLAKLSWWWMPALVAILLSQFLIIVYWPSAKAGTIVNILMLIAMGIGYGQWEMNQTADRIIKGNTSELSKSNSSHRILDKQMLNALPGCVQHWLTKSGVVGKPMPTTVRLTQKGWLKTTPTGKWMPSTATQFFNAVEPAFVWQVKTNMNPLVWFWGRDESIHGQGKMLIKAYATLPIVNAEDDKIDQGSLQRWLAEICWFPSAALSPYIQWDSISLHAAKANLHYKGVAVSMNFAFDEEGRLVSCEGLRYVGSGASASKQPWFIPVRGWKTFHETQIPSAGDVIWKLAEGDFNYFSWEIVSIDYGY